MKEREEKRVGCGGEKKGEGESTTRHGCACAHPRFYTLRLTLTLPKASSRRAAAAASARRAR